MEKIKAIAVRAWAKVKPWLQSKSKALAALVGAEAALYIGALLSIWLFGAHVDWNAIDTTAVTTLFGAFGITYFAPANKPLD